MKVEIDADLCTGCGLCEETYDDNDEECIEEAIESCPTEAITAD